MFSVVRHKIQWVLVSFPMSVYPPRETTLLKLFKDILHKPEIWWNDVQYRPFSAYNVKFMETLILLW